MDPIHRFDDYQQRRRGLAIPIAVFKKFGDDQGGNLAALVAYYGFFSLFPLLLVMTTVLGFVLKGNTTAQQSVSNSVLAQFPVVGKQIQSHALTGSAIALAIGVITALLGGLGVTSAAQNALDRVWAVPMKDRPNFINSRLRGLGLVLCLGLLFLISTVASGFVAGGFGGIAAKVLGYIVSLLVNLGLFFLAFRFMTSKTVTTQDLRVGASVAAVLWTILQAVGGYYVGNVVKKNQGTYGVFALVIALLVWLHLGAQLTLYAAEINVVLKRRLWPRSLFGPPDSPADKVALTALAKVEERSDKQHVAVEFDPQIDGPPVSGPA